MNVPDYPGFLPGDVIIEQLAGGHNPFTFSAPFFLGQVLAESPNSVPSAVPVPAAFWLFGTALAGFIGFSRRRTVG
jgi:hypothetical protein